MGFSLLGLATNAAGARNAYSGGQRAEEDSQLQKALLLRQIQQQDQQQKLAQALGQSNIGVNTARVADMNAQAGLRTTQDANQKAANQKAYNTLKSVNPQHPLVATSEFDPGTDYQAPLKEAITLDQASQKAKQSATAGYNIFKAQFPDHPLSKAQLPPEQIANYDWSGAIKDEGQKRQIAAQSALEDKKLEGQRPRMANFVDAQGGVHFVDEMEAARQGWTKQTAAGGGGQSLSAEDRAKMKAQAQLDNATMKAYEAKVLASGKSPGMVAGLAGALSSAHGGALASATGIMANKAAGMTDPEYQRYITAQRSYGRIMGNLQSKRYTDNQAEIERSISGLQGADLAGTIRYKQQLRDASLADPGTQPLTATPGGGRGGGGTPDVNDVEGYLKHLRTPKP